MSRVPDLIKTNTFYGWGYNDGLVKGIMIGAGLTTLGLGLGILLYTLLTN